MKIGSGRDQLPDDGAQIYCADRTTMSYLFQTHLVTD